MPHADDAPLGNVEGLHEKLKTFAEQHGLLIWDERVWKIDWMATHQGRCACDWIHRICPCPEVFQDLERFKGNCLCRVFFIKERLEQVTREKVKIELTPLEIKQREEMRDLKRLKDEQNLKKITARMKKEKKRFRKIVEV